jgi:hypothetical protein
MLSKTAAAFRRLTKIKRSRAYARVLLDHPFVYAGTAHAIHPSSTWIMRVPAAGLPDGAIMLASDGQVNASCGPSYEGGDLATLEGLAKDVGAITARPLGESAIVDLKMMHDLLGVMLKERGKRCRARLHILHTHEANSVRFTFEEGDPSDALLMGCRKF